VSGLMTATGCGCCSALHRFDHCSWRSSWLSSSWRRGGGPSSKSLPDLQAVRKAAQHLSLHRASRLRASFGGVPDEIVCSTQFQALDHKRRFIGPFQALAEINRASPAEGPIQSAGHGRSAWRMTHQVSIGTIVPTTTARPHQVKPLPQRVSSLGGMLVTILDAAPAAREGRGSSAPLSTTSRRLSARVRPGGARFHGRNRNAHGRVRRADLPGLGANCHHKIGRSPPTEAVLVWRRSAATRLESRPGLAWLQRLLHLGAQALEFQVRHRGDRLGDQDGPGTWPASKSRGECFFQLLGGGATEQTGRIDQPLLGASAG